MKKIMGILYLVICMLILTSCFNYRDINKLLFATAIIIDIDEENHPIIYIEAFKAVEGTETGERLIYRGKGKTSFEALRNINLGTSFKFNVTQNKALIFTTKAAEHGIDKYIDFFHRDQEFLNRQFMCIYNGEIDNLTNIKIKENKYIGDFLKRLLDNVGASSRATRITINEYLNQRLVGDKANVVPLIEVKQDVGGDNKIVINGSAVVKNDKMIEIIPKELGQGFNFLLNNVKSGTLEVTNPDFPDEFVTLEILKSKTDTQLKLENDRLKVNKNIKVKTDIAEVQEGLEINKHSLNQIKEVAQDNIRKACYKIFDEYKEKGVDIFDITEEFERKYPKEQISNVMEKTDLFVDVKVEIESGNDDLDFINVSREK